MTDPIYHEPLLSPEQAAALLGVSPGTLCVWRSVRRYNLPFVKIGSRVKYRRTDLESFISARTRGAVVVA